MLKIMENQMENKDLKNGRQMEIETIMSLLAHCLRSCDESGWVDSEQKMNKFNSQTNAMQSRVSWLQ